MKAIDFLMMSKELLMRLQVCGIKLDDVKYVDMYIEYDGLRAEGYKITYIVNKMAEKYSISIRKVYTLIKEFENECTVCAVR